MKFHFKPGQVLKRIGTNQISIVLDFDGKRYRTNSISDVYGNTYVDEQKHMWHDLKDYDWVELSPLEVDLWT